jgi:hypothetical protein
MSGFLRKLRGALGMAVSWAVGWGVLGFGVISVSVVLLGDPNQFWETVGPLTALTGLSGFVGGAVFSLVLGAGYRRRRLGELKPGRMALWGAGAALFIPAALLGVGLIVHVPVEAGLVAGVGAALGALGAGTAGGMVWLAQKADGGLGGGEDLDRLTDGT